jgi:hypothetical protein
MSYFLFLLRFGVIRLMLNIITLCWKKIDTHKVFKIFTFIFIVNLHV